MCDVFPLLSTCSHILVVGNEGLHECTSNPSSSVVPVRQHLHHLHLPHHLCRLHVDTHMCPQVLLSWCATHWCAARNKYVTHHTSLAMTVPTTACPVFSCSVLIAMYVAACGCPSSSCATYIVVVYTVCGFVYIPCCAQYLQLLGIPTQCMRLQE